MELIIIDNVKNLFFSKPRRYRGRNGSAQAIGLCVHFNDHTDTVSFMPINSKNLIGSCDIEIPTDSITELLQELNKWNPEPVRIDTSDRDFLKQLHAMVCNNCAKRGFNEPCQTEPGLSKCEFCGNIQKIQ
jgi:hypothetical protein